jgi:hypothetical protein
MGTFWTWLKDEANRKVLTWIVAGLGSIAIYFGFFKPDEKKPIAPASQTAISTGGTAVNASGKAAVNINQPDAGKSLTTAPQPSALPSAPAAMTGGQTAVSSGGTAINASGNAQVNVKP